MTRRQDIPDFYGMIRQKNEAMSEAETFDVLESGKRWDLAPVLRAGGALIFGHLEIAVEGAHYAAAVHACMNCGARLVLGVGVLHALTQELQDARVRVAAGADVTREPAWGIQGDGLDAATGKTHWHREFSMLAFQHLWHFEARRRSAAGLPVPRLVIRYPYLAGGRPHLLPGVEELRRMVADGAVVVGTADPFHHGLAYGDSADSAKAPNDGGLELCRETVQAGFDMLGAGDYWGFNQHCVAAKSDGRDMGQVVRYILDRPFSADILDIAWDDMSGPYGKPWPSWVAGCLIALTPRERRAGDLH